MNGNVTILDVVTLAREIRDKQCSELGMPFRGEGLSILTSGLDVGLTLMEESLGAFKGLSEASAKRIITYFEEEYENARTVNPEIALWYWAWAKAIGILFIFEKKDGGEKKRHL